jgi:hypothetical protein
VRNMQVKRLIAEFIVSDWGDKVNSGIVLYPMKPGEPVRQSYPGVDYISQSVTMNLASEEICH